MEVPSVVFIVSEVDPVIVRDHSLVKGQDGLVTSLLSLTFID